MYTPPYERKWAFDLPLPLPTTDRMKLLKPLNKTFVSLPLICEGSKGSFSRRPELPWQSPHFNNINICLVIHYLIYLFEETDTQTLSGNNTERRNMDVSDVLSQILILWYFTPLLNRGVSVTSFSFIGLSIYTLLHLLHWNFIFTREGIKYTQRGGSLNLAQNT